MRLDTLAARSRNLALFERYGALLTKHQQEVLDLSLRSDWSLAEIAGHKRTSRAAVHDIVKRSVGALEEFEALSDRLAAVLKKISGRGVLRPEDVEAGLREVRLALLEADVNFRVVKEFVDRIRSRLVGVEVGPGLTAPQQVVKAVNDELVEMLGGNSEGLRYAPAPPTVIMLAGLQGSGKTTTAVKLALLA